MKSRFNTVSPEVRAVLEQSAITERTLRLPPGQLERKLYVEVDKVIKAAGGKWNRAHGLHVFKEDPREALGMAIESGKILNEKATFQSFDTPDELADRLVELANIPAGESVRILEPSAGTGNIVRAIRRVHAPIFASIAAVEIDHRKQKALFDAGATTVCIDNFITKEWGGLPFCRVIMNPPFSNGQAILHVRHAQKYLARHGRIVAIVPDGPKERDALQGWALDWIELPAGTFKESGTNVRTAIYIR